ncbi:glycosyltransferase [Ornithinimicrobium pratense]|uniref:Glycosyltransferase family 4 protein n=1 Tax=Ornithinimicrobium pratense TaxID=2593973 RepID=A0A5J6V3Z6_9MICO|nr:hypothetical protein [Ornithinimicrobium pratense]QFG68357.1 hypothetical protein FY030_06195 [Ornithinimicrobium pratense]
MSPLRGPRRWAYQAWTALPSPVRGIGETVLRLRAEREVARQPGFDPGSSRRLVVGPLNTAGQGERWALAAQTLPGTSARAMSLGRRGRGGVNYGYPSHWHLPRTAQLRGMAAHRARILGTDGQPGATHVLAESAWAVLDDPYERWITQDLDDLRGAGIDVAVVVHGSEMRDLRRHAAAYPHSPFRGEWDERWERLQATVERTRAVLAKLEGSGVPVFVPTPDMLEHVPRAALLPITADVDRFSPGAAQPLLRREQPVVLHAPTNPRLKGTAAVEEVLTRLQEEGLVVYRRLTGVPHTQMPAFVADADVVVDQVVLGNVATLAAESMAAGRLVVGHVADHVRERTPGLPVLEAVADTLEDVLRDVVAHRDRYRDLAARGPAWAREHHDGRAAARALSPWLGI